VAAVQYTFLRRQHTEQYSTHLHTEQYSTHLRTDSTQNNTVKQNTQSSTFLTVRIHKQSNTKYIIYKIKKNPTIHTTAYTTIKMEQKNKKCNQNTNYALQYKVLISRHSVVRNWTGTKRKRMATFCTNFCRNRLRS